MAVENKQVLDETQKQFFETTNKMRQNAGSSPMGQYFSGLKNEFSTLKSEIKKELGGGTDINSDNITKKK